MENMHKAECTSKELDSKIVETKSRLDEAKKEQLKVSDFIDGINFEDFAGLTIKDKRAQARDAKREARGEFEQRVALREETVQRLQSELGRFETDKEKPTSISDFPSLLVLGLGAALQKMPGVCKGRYKTTGKTSTLLAWNAAAKVDATLFRGLGELATCIKAIWACRLSKAKVSSEEKLKEHLRCLSGQDVDGLRLAFQMGTVDDLMAISMAAGEKPSASSVDCLRLFRDIDAAAKERVALFDRLHTAEKEKAASVPESDVDGEDMVFDDEPSPPENILTATFANLRTEAVNLNRRGGARKRLAVEMDTQGA
mmetsp:Transcript_126923/g.406423  ORF Transcript_126923/g.406423 Transcript_126923/m.406423 type:complete len:313 (+) Transcript_126923:749-1687(+)